MTDTPATSMADLMKKQTVSARSLTRGQTVEGTIKKLTPQEILVDVSAKAPAIVLENDRELLHKILETMHVGEKVAVYILTPEGEAGVPVVSLRKHLESAGWQSLEAALKEKKQITVVVGQQTRGGYVVTSQEGLQGFLPNSYTTSRALLFGSSIVVSLVEIHRVERRFVVSQKELVSKEDFMKLSKKVKQGSKVSITVKESFPNGILVTVIIDENETLPGFIRTDEASWESFDAHAFTSGMQLEAEVVSLDSIQQRVMLSLKRLSKDPLENVFAQLTPDTMLSGRVVAVDEKGITVDIGKSPIVGFIKSDSIPAGKKLVEGESIDCTVTSASRGERRVYLSPVLSEKPMFYR